MKVYFCGDLHLREDEPFFSSCTYVLKDLTKRVNCGDVIVFAGDFFHKQTPTIKELKTARVFFDVMNRKACQVIICAGNHEYNGAKDAFVEDIFTEFDVTFVDSVRIRELDTCNILFLPWISNYRLKKSGCESLQAYYKESYDKLSIPSNKKNFVVYHFEDETQFVGFERKGIDLRFIKEDITRIGGHIHISSNNYIGVPYATRKDESGQKCKILEWDGTELNVIEYPELIKWVKISAEDIKTTRFSSKVNYILDVCNVKSIDELIDFIASKDNLFLDNYELLFGEERQISEEKTSNVNNVKEFLKVYISQNKVDKETSEYLLGMF